MKENKNYIRSNNYRTEFFKKNKGPYRCVYCNKKLTKKQMEIDHLIPVSKSAHSMILRVSLKIFGIKNINDTKNLVPSCRRCNRRKGAKIGLWTIRGFLGRFKLYWILLYMFLICTLFYIFGSSLSMFVKI